MVLQVSSRKLDPTFGFSVTINFITWLEQEIWMEWRIHLHSDVYITPNLSIFQQQLTSNITFHNRLWLSQCQVTTVSNVWLTLPFKHSVTLLPDSFTMLYVLPSKLCYFSLLMVPFLPTQKRAQNTREPKVRLQLSPRGSLEITKALKQTATGDGRDWDSVLMWI